MFWHIVATKHTVVRADPKRKYWRRNIDLLNIFGKFPLYFITYIFICISTVLWYLERDSFVVVFCIIIRRHTLSCVSISASAPISVYKSHNEESCEKYECSGKYKMMTKLLFNSIPSIWMVFSPLILFVVRLSPFSYSVLVRYYEYTYVLWCIMYVFVMRSMEVEN